jgi:hypothetical protein
MSCPESIAHYRCLHSPRFMYPAGCDYVHDGLIEGSKILVLIGCICRDSFTAEPSFYLPVEPGISKAN